MRDAGGGGRGMKGLGSGDEGMRDGERERNGGG